MSFSVYNHLFFYTTKNYENYAIFLYRDKEGDEAKRTALEKDLVPRQVNKYPKIYTPVPVRALTQNL